MDIDFWDSLLQTLSFPELDWLEIRIKRRKASMRPDIIVRKTIITKK